MVPLSPIYIFVFFLFVIAMSIALSVLLTKKNRKSDVNLDEKNKELELLPFVEQILRQLNCGFQHSEKESWHEYSFKYQSGNFLILCKEQDNLLRIHYPHFFSTKIDDLDLVREVCNTCNAHGFSHHVLYTADGKTNRLALHITSALSVVDDNEKYGQLLADMLSHFFSLAQEFYLRYDKAKERYKDVSPYDAEEDYLKYEREFFMLREMEMNHQPSKDKLVASSHSPLTISRLLDTVYGWKNPEFLELKIVTHQMSSLVNEREISDFDISSVLVAPNTEGEPTFIGRNATLILTFSSDRNQQECFPRQMVIALKNEGASEESLYQRATLSMPPTEPHNKNSEYAQDNTKTTLSFLFAYDKTDREQITAKTQETLNSLSEKCNKSDFEQLTSEEIIAFKFDNPDIRYYMAHAESLFRQKRYYETVTELEFLYNYMSPRFVSLSKKDQNTFYEVCYYLGFSYHALGLNKQAYYYLDAVGPLNHLTYMEEYVNCLVDAKDFRALSIIENMETLIKNQVADAEGGIPEHLQRFSKFLQRRKAHHLIDLGYYDKAQEMFQAMYQDPECQDYALNELAYLQKLRGKGQPQEDGNADSI